MAIDVPPPVDEPNGDAGDDLLGWWRASGTTDSPNQLHFDALFADGPLALLDRFFGRWPSVAAELAEVVGEAAAACAIAPIPADVALFNRLVSAALIRSHVRLLGRSVDVVGGGEVGAAVEFWAARAMRYVSTATKVLTAVNTVPMRLMMSGRTVDTTSLWGAQIVPGAH